LIKTTVVKSNQNKITNEIDTYAIHGSFMIFNKTYFTKGGSINYPSLLFGEEIFVAETALQRGLKVIYEPSLHIEHRQNATTNSFKSKKLVQLMNQSYRYLLKTFFIK
jgi:GT2 family glycosyltransferase